MRTLSVAFSLMVAGIILAGIAVPGGTAWAQSSDQIIDALRPKANQLGTGPTRGIRTLPGLSEQTTATAAPVAGTQHHPQPIHGHQQAANRLTGGTAPASQVPDGAAPSINLPVEFKTGSAELTPQAIKTITILARALTSPELARYHFRIEGHTDTVGSPETNKALSEQRAAAVADYLIQKFGVAADRLVSVGKGEEDLAIPTPPQTPEQRNRRVQIVNISA